jgi:hypothetical protein
LAGRSPICWAVLVQIEHCAATGPEAANSANTNIKLHFFMLQKYGKLKVKSLKVKSAETSFSLLTFKLLTF